MTIPERDLDFMDGEHLVHLYGTDLEALARAVGGFVADGRARGHGTLAIVGPENWEAIAAELERRGIAIEAAVADGSLVLLDAAATLASFVVDGRPDRARFDATVGVAVRAAARRDPGVRLYGEMVGLLWAAGDAAAAAALEMMWNDLLASVPVRLFCSYPVDVFGADFERANMDAILCAHSHLVPTTPGSGLAAALDRGMETVLGVGGARSIKSLIQPNHRPAWGAVPEAESTILWLRNNLPAHADEITAIARAYFRE